MTESGRIQLTSGEEFNSPSLAAIRAVEQLGGTGMRNGWHFWKTTDGKLLDELRKEYAALDAVSVTSDVKRFRSTFWDGFYDFCSANSNFVGVFGDQSSRWQNNSSWATFGIGIANCHLEANISTYYQTIGVDIYCKTAESYRSLWGHKEEVGKMVADLDGDLTWDGLDLDKKARSAIVRKSVDFDNDDWNAMYTWMAEWLCRLKAVVTKFVK